MHFLILTDYYHPIIKSGAIIVGDLTTELINNGHYVTIITFSDLNEKKIQESW